MLRVFYFCLATLLCLGLATLGLWPWAIKPRLHDWMSEELRVAGASHGLLLSASSFNVNGMSEVELIGARVDDVNKGWSVQAPLVTIHVSPIALLFGAQPLRRVHLTNPVVMGTIQSSEAQPTKFELPPGLKELTIENGLLQLEDPKRNASLQISYLNARVRKRFLQYQLTMSSAQAFAEFAGREIGADHIAFSGSFVDGKSAKHISIRSFELNTTAGSLVAQGRVDFDGNFNLRSPSLVHVRSELDLRPLGKLVGASPSLSGSTFASFQVGLDKEAKSVWAHGSLGGRDVTIDDVAVELFESEVSLAKRVVQLSHFEALFGGTLVRAEAEIKPWNDWEVGVSANFAHMSLFDLLGDIGVLGAFVDMGLDGRIEAHGQFSPRFFLQGKLSGEGTNFVVANRNARKSTPLDHVLVSTGPIQIASNLDIDATAFRFREAVISDGFSKVTTNCALHFEKGEGINLDLSSEFFDFKSIGERLADQKYQGTGRFSGSLNGAYEDIKIAGNAQFNAFSYEGLDFGTVKSQLSYHADDLVFSNVLSESTAAKLQGALTLSFVDDVEINLNVDSFTLQLPHFSKTLEHAQVARRLASALSNAQGVATGQLAVKGPASSDRLDELEGVLHATFTSGLQVGDLAIDSAELSLASTEDAWTIEKAVAKVAGGSFFASGAVTKRDLESSLTFNSKAIEISNLLNADGVVEGAITITGTLNNPIVGGQISLTNLETEAMAFGNQELTIDTNERGSLTLGGQLFSSRASISGELDLDLARPWAQLNNIRIASDKGDEVVISGVCGSQEETNVNISAAIDLSNIALPSDSIEAMKGFFQGSATITGSILDPEWKGNFDVRDGYLIHNQIGQPVEGISAQLTLTGKEVILDSLKGRAGRGFVEGHGWAIFDGIGVDEVESRFTFNLFPFQTASMLAGSASGFVEFRKLEEELSLVGDVRIKDGFVSSDLNLDDFKFHSGAHVSGNPIRMDVRVRTDEPIRMDTDFVSGEIEGNVHVVGNHLSPGLVGSVEVKGGRANFRNHEYDLRKARIDFDDSFRIVPRLDIIATGEVDDYAIQAHLRGTPERPQLRLTSDPYLPESQLLVLMSLGYATQDVKGVAATARTTGLEALSLYLGLGHNVMRFLNRHGSKDFFQLEDLSLSSIFSKTDGVSLPALRIGMNVWSGLKLRMHSALVENESNKREQRVELEQSLGHQMKWRLGWDSDGISNYGDAGLDVWFRWEIE